MHPVDADAVSVVDTNNLTLTGADIALLANLGIAGVQLLTVEVEGQHYHLPPLFGVVEAGVFRCGFPSSPSFPFLRQLRLRTVINLLDRLPDDYSAFLQSEGITYVHCPVKGNKAHCEEMDRKRVRLALSLIMDARRHPLLIHCRSGKHRTGALIGCLRMLQAWDLERACDEYVLYCQHKQREVDKQYIERFDPRTLSAVSPPCQHVPEWIPPEACSRLSALQAAIDKGLITPAQAAAGLRVSAIYKGPDEPGGPFPALPLPLPLPLVPMPQGALLDGTDRAGMAGDAALHAEASPGSSLLFGSPESAGAWSRAESPAAGPDHHDGLYPGDHHLHPDHDDGAAVDMAAGLRPNSAGGSSVSRTEIYRPGSGVLLGSRRADSIVSDEYCPSPGATTGSPVGRHDGGPPHDDASDLLRAALRRSQSPNGMGVRPLTVPIGRAQARASSAGPKLVGAALDVSASVLGPPSITASPASHNAADHCRTAMTGDVGTVASGDSGSVSHRDSDARAATAAGIGRSSLGYSSFRLSGAMSEAALLAALLPSGGVQLYQGAWVITGGGPNDAKLEQVGPGHPLAKSTATGTAAAVDKMAPMAGSRSPVGAVSGQVLSPAFQMAADIGNGGNNDGAHGLWAGGAGAGAGAPGQQSGELHRSPSEAYNTCGCSCVAACNAASGGQAACCKACAGAGAAAAPRGQASVGAAATGGAATSGAQTYSTPQEADRQAEVALAAALVSNLVASTAAAKAAARHTSILGADGRSLAPLFSESTGPSLAATPEAGSASASPTAAARTSPSAWSSTRQPWAAAAVPPPGDTRSAAATGSGTT